MRERERLPRFVHYKAYEIYHVYIKHLRHCINQYGAPKIEFLTCNCKWNQLSGWKEVVLKVELYDDKGKKKGMMKVSGLSGVDSITSDMMEKTLTVIRDIDPIDIVSKLRKPCRIEILSVGPAKEPEKKKDEPKKADEKKKDDMAELSKAYQAYNYNNSYMAPHYSLGYKLALHQWKSLVNSSSLGQTSSLSEV